MVGKPVMQPLIEGSKVLVRHDPGRVLMFIPGRVTFVLAPLVIMGSAILLVIGIPVAKRVLPDLGIMFFCFYAVVVWMGSGLWYEVLFAIYGWHIVDVEPGRLVVTRAIGKLQRGIQYESSRIRGLQAARVGGGLRRTGFTSPAVTFDYGWRTRYIGQDDLTDREAEAVAREIMAVLSLGPVLNA